MFDFTCEGGDGFQLELCDSMQQGTRVLFGPCDGTQELAWPILADMSRTIHVSVGDDVRWRAAPHFSTAEFAYDDDLVTECAAFTEIFSAIVNADHGFGAYGAFGEGEWRDRVDAAVGDLRELIATSKPSLGGAFEGVASRVSAADVGAAQNDWDEDARSSPVAHRAGAVRRCRRAARDRY